MWKIITKKPSQPTNYYITNTQHIIPIEISAILVPIVPQVVVIVAPVKSFEGVFIKKREISALVTWLRLSTPQHTSSKLSHWPWLVPAWLEQPLFKINPIAGKVSTFCGGEIPALTFGSWTLCPWVGFHHLQSDRGSKTFIQKRKSDYHATMVSI